LPRQSYWCIVETLKQAGLRTWPYHVYVPAFGEWGFVLTGTGGFEPPARLPGGLRYLSSVNLPQLFVFPNDMLPIAAEPNRLNDQVLVRYYEREWREIAPVDYAGDTQRSQFRAATPRWTLWAKENGSRLFPRRISKSRLRYSCTATFRNPSVQRQGISGWRRFRLELTRLDAFARVEVEHEAVSNVGSGQAGTLSTSIS